MSNSVYAPDSEQHGSGVRHIINPSSGAAGTDYEGLLNANPYSNLDYRESGWQSFLGALGFRTGLDTRKEDMQVQANEFATDVLLKQHDEEYNSPSAAAARMRAAGLNPDLVGIDNAGSAAPMNADENPPASSADDSQSVMQFANTIMSAVSISAGFAKDLKAIEGLRLANEGKDIENVQGLMNTALDAVLKHIPASYGFMEHDTGLSNGVLWQEQSSDLIGQIYRGTMSRRQYKRFMHEVNSFLFSAPADAAAYKAWRSNLEERHKYGLVSQNKYFGGATENVMKVIADELAPLAEKSLKQGMKYDAESKENAATYEEKLGELGVPESSAELESKRVESDFATLENTKQNAGIQKSLRSALSRITSRLEKASEGGDVFASIVLSVLGVLSMMNFNPSFSHSGFHAEGVDRNGNPTSAESSSSSFGF